MNVTFDPAKNAANIQKHGLSFAVIETEFDFSTAIHAVDTRKDYGEIRWVLLGFVGSRLHSLCFTETDTGIRVISFRKANSREIKAYENA